MAMNWLAFAGGAAEAGSEYLSQKRKENAALAEAQVKMLYSSYTEKKKKSEEKIDALSNEIKYLRGVLPDSTENELFDIAQAPNLLETIKKAAAENNGIVDPRIINTSGVIKAVGQSDPRTAEQMAREMYKLQPKPAASVGGEEPKKEQEDGFLGFLRNVDRVQVEDAADKVASVAGVSLQDLRGAQGFDLPDYSPKSRLDAEFIESQLPAEKRLEKLNSKLISVPKGSPEYNKTLDQISRIAADAANVGANTGKVADRIESLKSQLADAETDKNAENRDDRIAQIKFKIATLQSIDDLTKKDPKSAFSYGNLRSSLDTGLLVYFNNNGYSNEKLASMNAIDKYNDNNGNPQTRLIPLSSEKYPDVNMLRKQGVVAYLTDPRNPHVRVDGNTITVKDNGVLEILKSEGITNEELRQIYKNLRTPKQDGGGKPAPAAPAPAPAPAAPSSARGPALLKKSDIDRKLKEEQKNNPNLTYEEFFARLERGAKKAGHSGIQITD